MSREKCLPTAQKALDKGSPSQRRGALGADTGILKTLDSAGFCFWRPFFSILLGDAISHSFKVRNQADGTSVIQMFGKNLVMENPPTEPHEAVLVKEEGDLDCVKAVMVNQTAIDFGYDGGYLQFRVKLYPKEVTEVRVIYFDKLDVAPSTDRIGYSIKTRARRYLSEFRDNYLSQSDFLYESAARIKQLLK